MSSAKKTVTSLLKKAGVAVNGKNSWDIQVHDERVFSRILAEGSMGVGESYMDGWWDVKDLDVFFTKIFDADVKDEIQPLRLAFQVAKAAIINAQTKARSKKVAEEHYDLGNELYAKMLCKNMQYTCGYYKGTKSLDKAQEKKLDLVCKKLGLKKGMTVLELGGGWGGLARWMAKKYGCKVTSYNISKEQVAYAREWCKGLDVTFVLDDYRHATGTYDRVVSVGMLEHVGYKNYDGFMELAHRCLKDEGMALFHTIGGLKSVKTTDPWLNKYIFPNSMLPSIQQLSKAMEPYFVVEDWHNFGAYYDLTLMDWDKNFRKAWPTLKKDYDERFYRMWRFYLMSCAALFRSRKTQLWQIVVSKQGVKGGYNRIS